MLDFYQDVFGFRFSRNAAIIFTFSIFHYAVSSKVQGTVKVRQFKKVRNSNSTPILICNPGQDVGALKAQVEEKMAAAAGSAEAKSEDKLEAQSRRAAGGRLRAELRALKEGLLAKCR